MKVTGRRRLGALLLCLCFLALCLLSRILVYIMVNIVLFRSAACIGLACFRQLPCAQKICSQCFSSRFLKAFNVPAYTMLGGKLFQLFITVYC